MPGLVNTHTHAPMVLYRGLADDVALMGWLERYIFPAEANFVSPEFVRVGTRLAALDIEWIPEPPTYADMFHYFEEEIAKRNQGGWPARRAGTDDHPVPSRGCQDAAVTALRARTRFIHRVGRAMRPITPAVAPHAMSTLDSQHAWHPGTSRAGTGVPVLIGLAETQNEVRDFRERHGLSPVAYLEPVLASSGPEVLAAHAIDGSIPRKSAS